MIARTKVQDIITGIGIVASIVSCHIIQTFDHSIKLSINSFEVQYANKEVVHLHAAKMLYELIEPFLDINQIPNLTPLMFIFWKQCL